MIIEILVASIITFRQAESGGNPVSQTVNVQGVQNMNCDITPYAPTEPIFKIGPLTINFVTLCFDGYALLHMTDPGFVQLDLPEANLFQSYDFVVLAAGWIAGTTRFYTTDVINYVHLNLYENEPELYDSVPCFTAQRRYLNYLSFDK